MGSSQEKLAAKETVSLVHVICTNSPPSMKTSRVIRSFLAEINKVETPRCVLCRSHQSTGLLWVGKRKVLSDSDDDAQEQRYGAPALYYQPQFFIGYSIKISTPKRPASNKKV